MAKRAGPVPRTIKKLPRKSRCIRGHEIGWGQDPLGCVECLAADRAAASAEPSEAYRARRRAELGIGPPASVLRVRTHDGQAIEYGLRPARR